MLSFILLNFIDFKRDNYFSMSMTYWTYSKILVKKTETGPGRVLLKWLGLDIHGSNE